MTQIQAIPLSQLRLSPKNSRKHRSKSSITAIAESLRIDGQLQNLVVTGPDDAGMYEVNAGGTRFMAFQTRLVQGEIASDFLIDCKIIGADSSREASLVENTLREPMHPADQFRAFRSLIDDGKSIQDVAAHFSIAPSVVQQRLKLANVAPDLFEVYEQDGMSLQQLQALALTDDHDAQRRGWFGIKGAKVQHEWQRTPDEIRKRITAKEIGPDNRLVGFVGADRYEAAGGKVRRDMFSTDVYFSDGKLLERLAAAKLEQRAERERAAGWSWVETHLALDYSARGKYGEGFSAMERRAPTEEERSRLAEIETRLEVIEDEIDDGDGDRFDALDRERWVLAGERDAINAGLEKWSKQAKEKSGVLIYIDQYQGLQIARGRLKPGQRLTSDTKASSAGDNAPKKPELSADMVTRLEMHRAAAIRYHVASRPAAALVLLISHLAARLLTRTSAESVLSLNPSHEHNGANSLIDTKFKDVGTASARKAIDMAVKAWGTAGLPDKASELQAWVAKLAQVKQIELLALLTALTIPTVRGARGAALADEFEVDMRTWWGATPEQFTSLVPKALLAAAVGEVAGKPAAEKILQDNKAGAVAEATRVLDKSGWLPKPLRGRGYTKAEPLPGPQASAPGAATKKAANFIQTSGDPDALKVSKGRRFDVVKTPAKKATKTAAAPAKKAAKRITKKPAKKATKAVSKRASQR